MTVSPHSSSFYWAMRLLPQTQRSAMYALYHYCRAADDIADGDGHQSQRLAQLSNLRGCVGALYESGLSLDDALTPLVPFVHRYDLPQGELMAVLDGMQADIMDQFASAPTIDALRLYCRQVAGSVGVLCLRILGRPDAHLFALHLGEALQLTNILRDVNEDAERGRLYIPLELLDEVGILHHGPQAALSHPALPQACFRLAQMAQAAFARARDELGIVGRHKLRPALVMMEIYHAQLQAMQTAGWQNQQQVPRLSRLKKLWIVVRHSWMS